MVDGRKVASNKRHCTFGIVLAECYMSQKIHVTKYFTGYAKKSCFGFSTGMRMIMRDIANIVDN